MILSYKLRSYIKPHGLELIKKLSRRDYRQWNMIMIVQIAFSVSSCLQFLRNSAEKDVYYNVIVKNGWQHNSPAACDSTRVWTMFQSNFCDTK